MQIVITTISEIVSSFSLKLETALTYAYEGGSTSSVLLNDIQVFRQENLLFVTIVSFELLILRPMVLNFLTASK